MRKLLLGSCAIFALGIAPVVAQPVGPPYNPNNVNIKGGVIAGVSANNANVTSTGGVLNSLATWMQALFTGWGTTLYCANYGSLQACHDALPSTGGKMLLPANTTYSATSTLTISKPNVTLECSSWNTIIRRASAFGTQLVNFTPPSSGGVIRNCTLDGNGTVYTGGYSEIQMNSANGLIEHIQVINGGGNIGIALAGVNSHAFGNTIVGLSSATVGGYGIWAINHVPVKIDYNTISGTKIDGIGFDGTDSVVNGNHLFNNQCNTSIGGGQIVVYSGYYNAVVSNNTTDTGCSTLSNGIEINGIDTSVTDNTINLAKASGITVDPGTNGVLISGNSIRGSGQAGAGAYGIIIQNTSNYVIITGNRIFDDQVTPTQTYGVGATGGTHGHITIVGNDLTGNIIAPINDVSNDLNKVIHDNEGVDDVVPSIASTFVLSFPVNPVFSLTGTTNIGWLQTAPGPVWTGRQVTIIPTGVLTFTAGNNIANTLSTVANVPIVATYDGTLWHLK